MLYQTKHDAVISTHTNCITWYQLNDKKAKVAKYKSLFHRDRMNLYCTFSEDIIPCLEFTMEFQSNQLIYQKEYTKRQQIIYLLIHHLHDREGWGYRKISKWLNQSGIKTHRGKNWFSSSVISVLKRKHERDIRNEQIRNQYFPSKVLKFEINYYIFDWIE